MRRPRRRVGRARPVPSDTLGILLLSGTHDRAHYAFVLASGAAALGRRAGAVRYQCRGAMRCSPTGRSWWTRRAMSVCGRAGVAGLAELREASQELDVRMIACEAGLRAEGLDAGAAVAGGGGRGRGDVPGGGWLGPDAGALGDARELPNRMARGPRSRSISTNTNRQKGRLAAAAAFPASSPRRRGPMALGPRLRGDDATGDRSIIRPSGIKRDHHVMGSRFRADDGTGEQFVYLFLAASLVPGWVASPWTGGLSLAGRLSLDGALASLPASRQGIGIRSNLWPPCLVLHARPSGR